MVESSEGQHGHLKKFILLVFFAGWIGAGVVFALFMRAWIPGVDLKGDLAALEEADTEEANLDRPIPAVLQPLAGALPALPTSGSTYVPLYSDLYVGGQRSLKNLSATLSLRNTAVGQLLIVLSVTYFDDNGQAVLKHPGCAACPGTPGGS